MEEKAKRNTTRSGSLDLKCYEEMLVDKLRGTSRHNEPMQAVIENQLDESALQETDSGILERNRALLQYIATIANSNSKTDEFNYEFVETLVNGGANINIADNFEQNIFHEVARSWNTDIATFLIEQGCDINKKDSFGRTPLHVAAAVDHVEMTEFLLQNNADIDARTNGEYQAPIHYAAKNGATRSLKLLLGFKANIDSLDAKQRTPLQLAAEWTRDKEAKVLLDEGAASCHLDSSGNSALAILIDRLPFLALEALNQLHTADLITMTDSYYLQYLEASRQKVETKTTRTPLETAVIMRKFEVVTHPVMQRLIRNKWIQYGRMSTIFDLLFHTVFGLMWTALSLGTPTKGSELYIPFETKWWRAIIGLFIILMTIYDIGRHTYSTVKSRRSQANWIRWRTAQLRDDLNYCHPRWPQERKHVDNEIKRIDSLPLFDAYGAWFYFEWIILVFIVATIASHFAHFHIDNRTSRYVYTRIISIVNLLVWLRLLRYVRPFRGIGTLVIILGETSSDFINWAFLFFILLVPFSASFWINFGQIALKPIHGYHGTGELIFTVFRMAVGDDFPLEEMVESDPVMSRILIVLYVTSMTIVTLNLLIALLSDTFSRVHGNAVANTIMQRAVKVVEAERTLTKKQRMQYREYMRLNCSPEVTKIEVDSWSTKKDKKLAEQVMRRNLTELKGVLDDRLGKVFGKNRASDFDGIMEELGRLRAMQDDLAEDLTKISEMVNLMFDKPLVFRKRRETAKDEKKNSAQNTDRRASKSFVTTLQVTAASLMPSWLTGNKEADSDAAPAPPRSRSRDRHSEAKTVKSNGEEKLRKRRRRRSKDANDGGERTKERKHRRRKGRSRSHGSSSNVQASQDPCRKNANTTGTGVQNPAYKIEHELAWDNVTIDSGKK